MACNSPPSPAVWENNSNNSNSCSNTNNNSTNGQCSNGSLISSIHDTSSSMILPASRGQAPYQSLADSSQGCMGDYSRHNWYQQQDSHFGLPHSGPMHLPPPSAASAAQSMGAVYWSWTQRPRQKQTTIVSHMLPNRLRRTPNPDRLVLTSPRSAFSLQLSQEPHTRWHPSELKRCWCCQSLSSTFDPMYIWLIWI